MVFMANKDVFKKGETKIDKIGRKIDEEVKTGLRVKKKINLAGRKKGKRLKRNIMMRAKNLRR